VAEPPAGGYSATWFAFDNDTGATSPIGTTQTIGTTSPAPAGLPGQVGDFVKIQVAAVDGPHDAWMKPVDVYFRRTEGGWKLVGLERLTSEVADSVMESHHAD
jgi:hypothetical protein